eukprot:TRINITY_DN16179_c0_g1_i1.p1 TRINITY_DN16179_c0_g1~~TRINITY_DN16179_c0_g1_i1.p1  ORF type:complete len:566 (+),score=73.42 TRINITY_DN16179_c0_g1_i1:31-1698(+)
MLGRNMLLNNNPENRYERLQMIGKGSFGQVYLVRNRATGARGVMKCISLIGMGREERRETMREASMLQRLDHPNVIKYIDSFDTRDSLRIVTEYAAKGDLSQLIQSRRGKRMPEKRILDLFLQICLALQYLHSRHVLHRDIKTSNIFLNDKSIIKLGDFGIAKVLAHTMQYARTFVGTPYYMSPELCQEKPYNNRSDIWALGCVLYELVMLRHAFEANNMRQLRNEILAGRYRPLHSSYSSDLSQLIASMLNKDPKQRPGITSILQLPFIKERIKAFLEDRSTIDVRPRKTEPTSLPPLVGAVPPRARQQRGQNFVRPHPVVQASPTDAVAKAQQRIAAVRRAQKGITDMGPDMVELRRLKYQQEGKRQQQQAFEVAKRKERVPQRLEPIRRPSNEKSPPLLPQLPKPSAPPANVFDQFDEMNQSLEGSMRAALNLSEAPNEDPIWVEDGDAVTMILPNGIDPTTKFQLNGDTYHVPNSSTTESLSNRIESLRCHLEDILGASTLLDVYSILSEVQPHSGKIALAKARSILGEAKVYYLPLVMQMMYCEDVLNQN